MSPATWDLLRALGKFAVTLFLCHVIWLLVIFSVCVALNATLDEDFVMGARMVWGAVFLYLFSRGIPVLWRSTRETYDALKKSREAWDAFCDEQ